MPSPSNPSRRNRKYTPAEKAAFFTAMDRLGNVSAASRDAGVPRNQGWVWAVKAGVPRHHGVAPQLRDRFFQLRAEGMHVAQAARHAGVKERTAHNWDAQARTGLTAWQRAVQYNSGVTSPPTAVSRVEHPIDARYLSVVEREQIRDLRQGGGSMRSIAVVLGRSAATISRELRRNLTDTGDYHPHAAHRIAASRRPRPKPSKLITRPALRRAVQERLQLRLSPEQICHCLIKDFPHDEEMRVSPETIYQALYFQARGGLRKEVQEALRSGRTRRKPHTTGQARRSRFIDPMIMISDRPAEIEDRAIPGHWEGDLITGTQNKSAIATLVERTTRYVMLVHLPGGHTAEEVRDGLVTTMLTLPRHLRGSLTWDQGAEMATHKSFTIATDMPVYFCDPGSPWQRGSNENTNGLLRQYFPKGEDLSIFSPEDLERVAHQLNGRLRKTLDWDTPAERLRDLLIPA